VHYRRGTVGGKRGRGRPVLLVERSGEALKAGDKKREGVGFTVEHRGASWGRKNERWGRGAGRGVSENKMGESGILS